jgi:hypothetical protein
MTTASRPSAAASAAARASTSIASDRHLEARDRRKLADLDLRDLGPLGHARDQVCARGRRRDLGAAGLATLAIVPPKARKRIRRSWPLGGDKAAADSM